MGKYVNEAKELLKCIGGKENIENVSHCVTRMRFVLHDPNKANIKAIENIPCTKGTFTQSGQFQVIIGNEVQLFYNDFIAVSGISEIKKETSKDSSSKQQTKLQKLMSDIGEIFAPLIPALICGGLVLGLSNYMDSVAILENGTKTLVETSMVFSSINQLLKLIGEAVFQFLPVAIVWSITKKMKTTQILGIILGLTLISPQLSNITVTDISFSNFEFINYQGQVIPAILSGFILVYLERFWRKISPESISIIIVPLLSLVPAVLIIHTLIGPVGYIIGDWLSHMIWQCLTFQFNWLIAGIFGFIYAILVITGLHHFTIPIDVQLASSFGGTILWPILALSNIAQGSAVLAMIVLQRKNEKAKQISIPACISCYLGVSEPALFGVNLKYKFPFICGLFGSAIAAMIAVSTGTTATSIGVGGIPGILSILPQYVFCFLLAMFAAISIPFVLTLIVGKRKLSDEDIYGKDHEVIKKEKIYQNLTSPIEGKIILLEDVEDQVFSQKLMGDGYAVDITNNTVVSPFDGEVVMTFPTNHAYGLKRDDGLEILIHLGMDTVQLNGAGFECLVEKGDKIKKGDMIAKIDLNYIKEQGKSLISPVIVTSGQKIKIIQTHEKILLNEEILEINEETKYV